VATIPAKPMTTPATQLLSNELILVSPFQHNEINGISHRQQRTPVTPF
jgi:hypothetical protein